MKTLCLDTAYKNLTIVIIEDDKIIASYVKECFKKQSEEVFVILNKLFADYSLNPLDIDAICISKGPGSYTGVRIAMTIAKVLATIKDIDLYTISTLQLYASDIENALVLMDARAKRAYVGYYDKGIALKEDMVIEIDKIENVGFNLILDAHLLNKEALAIDYAECFLKTKDMWKKEDDIAHLVPFYLKASEAYLK